MLYLQGAQAHTAFRRKQLLRSLQQKLPTVTAFTSHFVYFVATQYALSNEQLTRLCALLPDSQLTAIAKVVAELNCWVVPRLGTLSPWSSKATDIAQRCGLSALLRIERGIYYAVTATHAPSSQEKLALWSALHDPMTESVIENSSCLQRLFQTQTPRTFTAIDIASHAGEALCRANEQLGMALTDADIDYLLHAYQRLGRNPSDVELMMFAQVNSEHCRHKLFNAAWTIDGTPRDQSLFDMIKNTQAQHPDQVLVAYQDNAAVIKGHETAHFFSDAGTHHYQTKIKNMPIVLKVETHNHPTAIAPFAGAATGSGGEIRDEAATGRGARSKAGLTGFSVSHLHIPDFPQPWETCIGKPVHIASALDIMLQGPIGAAAFNNEFGRPNVCGYFRTFEMMVVSPYGEICRGYHKPIMLAGGIGNIQGDQTQKHALPPGALLIVIGGPAMLIGLGGGAASSRTSGQQTAELDFASVQRANPEMQRRTQELINRCCELGADNPILSIHDVGAGGLSNAIPEIVAAAERGARLQLRTIPTAELGMTPLELWCNEAQERFVLVIEPAALPLFTTLASRERCPFAVLGEVTAKPTLQVSDDQFANDPVSVPLSLLFDDTARLQCQDDRAGPVCTPFATQKIPVGQAIERVLQYPCVGDKSFLITIADRSVGGLIARDQMIGPWQVPVADVAVTCANFSGFKGEALALGERAPISLIHHAAAARMAVGEAITNIVAAAVDDIAHIVLSANWMAAADYPGEGAGLYAAVQTIGMELCPALGISIPVGKDSLSLRTTWQDRGQTKSVTAPSSLVITAAARVGDVRATLTPQLHTDSGDTRLLLIDLGKGANCIAGSVLAQCYNTLGERPADVDDPAGLRCFFKTMQALRQQQLVLAYHDRSDGGLLVTLCEMAFAGHTGITVDIGELGDDTVASLFSEELGAVIQIKQKDWSAVAAILQTHQLAQYVHDIGTLNPSDDIVICFKQQELYRAQRSRLHRLWSETSYRLQALRDNPDCAQQQYDQLLQRDDPGLTAKLTFTPTDHIAAPFINLNIKPKVAILREQGVNGHVEMAAAFYQVGFTSVDVHMTDLLQGHVTLDDFKGLVACGGFSYGDVLGAGRGWAQSILMHAPLQDAFQHFFHRRDSFALGVCNGCQLLSHLRALIPGAEHWPTFKRNQSEQFEARLSLVEIPSSPSVFFHAMAGSVIPIVVSHGEGRVVFATQADAAQVTNQQLVTLRYVDHQHQPTEHYPFNPNGSRHGMTGFTTPDGRVTIMMPHPERVFRSVQCSWHPRDWPDDSPWMRLFANARVWVG